MMPAQTMEWSFADCIFASRANDRQFGHLGGFRADWAEWSELATVQKLR
jgi:hypothetical protein